MEITFEEIHPQRRDSYAIYNYTNYTGDESYLAKEGLEVLVSIPLLGGPRPHPNATANT